MTAFGEYPNGIDVPVDMRGGLVKHNPCCASEAPHGRAVARLDLGAAAFLRQFMPVEPCLGPLFPPS